MRVICLILLTLCLSVPIVAQKVKRVSAEYTYISNNEEETPKQARQTAIQKARSEAIKKEFGERVISRTEYIGDRKVSGEETEVFREHDATELNGEWIKTIKEEVRKSSFENGFWEITVFVEGMAREIALAGVDFEYHILRNGTTLRHEEKNFKSGDKLMLSFKSPVDGYLAVYVVDDKTAYCVLPYQEQKGGIYSIRANREYILFSDDHKQEGEDSYNVTLRTLTTNDADAEINEVYVIFSARPFTKATDNDGEIINDRLTFARHVEIKKFLDWLSKSRSRDVGMKVETSAITIRK